MQECQNKLFLTEEHIMLIFNRERLPDGFAMVFPTFHGWVYNWSRL